MVGVRCWKCYINADMLVEARGASSGSISSTAGERVYSSILRPPDGQAAPQHQTPSDALQNDVLALT